MITVLWVTPDDDPVGSKHVVIIKKTNINVVVLTDKIS
jgi:hypothetical protein